MAQSNDNRQSKDNGKLSAAELGQAALTTVEELAGYEPQAVTALTWYGDFWQITVDVLELARIPNTTDVLGSYVVQLHQGGTLHGYRGGPPFGGGGPCMATGGRAASCAASRARSDHGPAPVAHTIGESAAWAPRAADQSRRHPRARPRQGHRHRRRHPDQSARHRAAHRQAAAADRLGGAGARNGDQ